MLRCTYGPSAPPDGSAPPCSYQTGNATGIGIGSAAEDAVTAFVLEEGALGQEEDDDDWRGHDDRPRQAAGRLRR